MLFSMIFSILLMSQSAMAKERINKKKIVILKGQSVTLSVLETKKKVRWSSSDKKVVSVSKKGKINGKAIGKAIVYAKTSNGIYKCKVTVEDPKLSAKKITLKVNETRQIELIGTTQKITWSSNNNKIAKVTKKGKIKGINKGKTKVIATIGKKKFECTVKVVVSEEVNTEDAQETTGEFYKLKSVDREGNNWGVKTKNNEIRFRISPLASNVKVNGSTLTYNINNNWIKTNILLETVKEIKSAPECELKVCSIVSKLPKSTFVYTEANNDPILVGVLGINSFNEIIPDKSSDFKCRYNVDDIWFVDIGTYGASYFYESSEAPKDNLSKETIIYHNMIKEGYHVRDGVTFHIKIEVKQYNYIDYYNSLQTTIEKRESLTSHGDVTGALADVASFVWRDNTDKGFGNCLFIEAKLIP